MENKLWYAVMNDNEDTDHGFGFFDKERAIKKAKEIRELGFTDAYVAVVDPNDDFTLEVIRDF